MINGIEGTRPLYLEFTKEVDEMSSVLIEIPNGIGNTVYTNFAMQGWYKRKEDRPYEAKVVFIGINGKDNFMNVEFEEGRMLQFKFSEIGTRVFLTKQEAEEALEKGKQDE